MTTVEYIPTLKVRDLEEVDWAGEDVNQLHIEAACGDPDDWFSARQRLEAAMAAKAAYNRHKGKPLRYHPILKQKKFKWGLIVIAGPMGAGKSTFAMIDSYSWHEAGHQVFHPGGFLIGRICSYAEMYNIVDNVPLYSIVIFDEAHSGLESGMSQTAGVAAFTQLMAGLRKKRCRVFLPSAMYWMLPPSIKRMTTEVWKPFKPEFRLKPGVMVGQGLKDPRNFVLGVDIFDDEPFTRMDDRHGFGPPSRSELLGTTVNSRRIVMRAMALVDTFKPVDPSVARKHATKAAQDANENTAPDIAQAATGYHKQDYSQMDAAIEQFIHDCEDELTTTTAIVAAVGGSVQTVGRRLKALYGEDIKNGNRRIVLAKCLAASAAANNNGGLIP